VLLLSSADGCSTQARSRLLDAAEQAGLAADSVEVLFSGVESGRVEAVLQAVPEGQVPHRIALLAWATDALTPVRRTQQLVDDPFTAHRAALPGFFGSGQFLAAQIS